MYKILEKIKSQIPRDYSGFNCIKTQEILIPYFEIGIECLVRNISDINLFFEMILRLVEIDIKDIKDISSILGVSIDITKEAVVDMVNTENIVVSENILKMTKKGEDALKSKKLVEIKKKNINKIMINLITGEVCDGTNIRTLKVEKWSVCLAEEIIVNKMYLDANYTLINQVFQVQQENDSVYGSNITKELYKIIDINYRKLVYIKNEVYLYKRNDSEEIQIQFASDVNSKYLNCLYSQLKKGIHPCLENFFERNRKFITMQSLNQTSLDQMLIVSTNKAKKELQNNDDLMNIDISKFENRRYTLVDKEYVNYFVYSDDLMFINLFIYINRVNSLLTAQIFYEINRIAEKKHVYILYDKNEFNVSKTINHFLGKANGKNLHIIPCENINKNIICFESCLIIEIQEQSIKAFEKHISYKTSVIDFNKANQKIWLDQIKEKYNIDPIFKKK